MIKQRVHPEVTMAGPDARPRAAGVDRAGGLIPRSVTRLVTGGTLLAASLH